jgi:glycosyltransferase involved in cell wall biosynthesis
VLVFVGSPSSFSKDVLKKLVSMHGLERRVFFQPAVDSMKLVHYIASADIGVVIYKNSCRNNYLCAPNKLFEYCMAGLPSIGCDFPPVRRVAEKYGVTMLFDPEDPASIAAAANSFIKNEVGYIAAKTATATVAAECTWECEESKLIELYNSLAPLNKTGTNPVPDQQ